MMRTPLVADAEIDDADPWSSASASSSDDEPEEYVSSSPTTRRELVNQLRIAGPVSTSMLCNRARDLLSIAFVGRGGSTSALAGAALASSFANVTGTAVVVGLSGAINTLAGQAYGAGAYERVGGVCQRGVVALTCACVVISAVWWQCDALLSAIGQEEEIAREAGTYARALIPQIFAYAWNICFQAFLQSQAVTTPQAVAGVIATVLHAPWCYVLTRAYGAKGAALATGVSTFTVLVVNLTYIFHFRRIENGRFRERDSILAAARDACWPGWSVERAFDREGMKEWISIAVPSLILMSEWVASELLIFFAGYLPKPDVAVAAMSIYQVTNAFAFMIAVGFGVATVTRVSNEVGAGNVTAAKLAADVALELIVGVELIVSTFVFASRHRWGGLFTDDPAVSSLLAELMIPLAVYVFFDAVCCVSTSIIRGVGRQAFAAPIVLFAYYAVGIPIALLLAFTASLHAVGLAIGGVAGTAAHAGVMTLYARRVDWRAEVSTARARNTAKTHASPGSDVHVDTGAALD